MVMICEREEVSVGDLFVALQLARDGLERFRYGKILNPEVVVLVRKVRRKKNKSIGGRERVTREGRIGD